MKTEIKTEIKILAVKAIVEIKGISPYSPNAFIHSSKETGEKADAFEKRTWRERINRDDDDNVIIPAMAFKMALDSGAWYLRKTIPQHGTEKYTPHFRAGVSVFDDLVLPIKVKDVPQKTLMVPSNGRRGYGSRVPKIFGVIEDWGGEVTFMIYDHQIIQREVFAETLNIAGMFIGVGRWRIEKGGGNGRFGFDPKKIKWEEISM